MKRLLAFFGGLMLCVILTPRLTLTQEIIWSRTFAFEDLQNSHPDYANSVQQTSEGGYILAGETSHNVVYSAWLLKTGSEGQKEWERTFEGSEDSGPVNVSRATSVKQTSDGGYILGGYTFASSRKAWIIKTDSEGQKEWKQIFDRSPLGDQIYSVQQTTDGGYILAGHTRDAGSAAWLIKTDSEGQKEWERTFPDEQSASSVRQTSAKSVQQTTDGGYILVGATFLHGKCYFWLLKTDSEGQQEWEKTFGGGDFTDACSVQQTTDGGYILVGRKDRGISTWDTWLIKTDSEGQQEWDRIFDDGEASLGPTSVKQTLDGGYILANWSMIPNVIREAHIIKTDSEGQKEWTTIFSRENSRFHPSSLLITSDGDYVVAGNIQHYGDYGCDAIDAWLAKIRGEQPQVSVEEDNKPSVFSLSQNFPNPFNPRTEITFEIPTDSQVTLTVFNALGQRVATLVDEIRQTGNHQVRWDGTEFPTGIYFYCLQTQGFSKTMKMLLMK